MHVHNMKEVTFQETLFDILDAIINDGFKGFKADYLILHSLIRKYKPKTFFEIGTCAGIGTNIICNAIMKDPKNIIELNEYPLAVYSLDLPPQEEYKSEQYNGGPIGEHCKFPYTQFREDSLTFDYSKYPCEGYWIDAEHCYKSVYHETTEVLKQKPILVAYHDTDLKDVLTGIVDAIKGNSEYELFRVINTRISYLLKK